MKLFVTVLLVSLLSICSSLPHGNVYKNTLESVDSEADGDLNSHRVRLARHFGGFGGFGGLGGFGGYPGGYGGYGLPFGGGGGYGGGFSGAQASAQSSSYGGGYGGGYGGFRR